MAQNRKISQLPSWTPTTSDVGVMVQGGVTKQYSLNATPVSATIQAAIDAGTGAVDSVNGHTGVVVLDASDIAATTNKNYVTDANLTVIGNTSGTNTGDNATNTQYSGLATSKQDTLVSGTNIKTINSTSLLGSGNITTGTGDVVWPASSTDNAIARYDLTTGKLLQNSWATIDDSGNLTATNFSGSSSGSNTGDQTSIVGITGTKAQFDTAVSDGNIVYTDAIWVSVQAYDADLTTIAGLTPTTDNFIQSKSSAWASRTPTQVTADLIAMVGDSGAGGTKGLVPAPAAWDAAASKFLKADGTWATTGAGGGTVTTVSVVSANGLAGTVANASSTPAITLSTSITGVLKGNGTAISAATSGTDYSAGTSGLATGILKSTTTTGALTIAVAGDFPTLNQNTTGSAATLTTPRAIYGNNFDGSAALTQVIASTYGGTGNGFAKISWPTTNEKTFTLPNASATILTDNTAVTVAQWGTGATTLTANNVILGNGTSAVQFVAPWTSGNVLTSNGTTWSSSAPAGWTPKTVVSTDYSVSTRYTETTGSGGSVVYDDNPWGARLVTGATGGGRAKIIWGQVSGKTHDLTWTTFNAQFWYVVNGSDYDFYIGMGDCGLAAASLTFTNTHIWFKVLRTGSGTATLYATNANGTTETATSLATLAVNDGVQVKCVVNSTSSIDYYYSVNGAAFSAATNHTTNIASTQTSSVSSAITNRNVASSSQFGIVGTTIQR